MAKQTSRRFIYQKNVDVTVGTNQYAFNNVENLHTLISSSITGDSDRIIIKKILVLYHGVSANSFTTTFFVVQTDGTLSDNNNTTKNRIHNVVVENCDDVAGIRLLGDSKLSKRALNIGSVGTDDNELNSRLELPQQVRDLLARETSTEDLQRLYLCMHYCGANGIAIKAQISFQIDYELRTKPLTIR